MLYAFVALAAGAALLVVRHLGVQRELTDAKLTLLSTTVERDNARAKLAALEGEVWAAQLAQEKAAAEHERRLRFFRERVEQCEDPAVRGAVALDALRELLRDELPSDDAAPN